ncbi:CLAVATA3/ESR (CLE)-related protein 12-like [Pyrus x bretschneideri]|uniref:CLAVATA3/ESR (CLE)-related protein 12-like n=1 Tax=Pyrus x bretschneideri TaxID=225117 RepID=UPI0020305F5A|nr:CLAVATA3/ESR (CLE)-related protein 12-like [Pyrus x bretschneideri]
MASKLLIPHLFSLMLWLSLLFLSVHGWFHLVSKNNNNHINPTQAAAYPLSSSDRRYTLSNRKVLLASKFDFSPFVHRHRHHQKHNSHKQVPVRPEPDRTEIGRDGSEMRIVPTGPNPLHH